MCSHLPGFALSAAVPVGMGAAIVAVLRLPLSAVVLATLLTSHAGPKVEPLIIVGVVVAYVVTVVMTRSPAPTSAAAPASRANPITVCGRHSPRHGDQSQHSRGAIRGGSRLHRRRRWTALGGSAVPVADGPTGVA